MSEADHEPKNMVTNWFLASRDLGMELSIQMTPITPYCHSVQYVYNSHKSKMKRLTKTVKNTIKLSEFIVS